MPVRGRPSITNTHGLARALIQYSCDLRRLSSAYARFRPTPIGDSRVIPSGQNLQSDASRRTRIFLQPFAESDSNAGISVTRMVWRDGRGGRSALAPGGEKRGASPLFHVPALTRKLNAERTAVSGPVANIVTFA